MGQTLSGFAAHCRGDARHTYRLTSSQVAEAAAGSTVALVASNCDLDDCELALHHNTSKRLGVLSIEDRILLIGNLFFEQLSQAPITYIDALSEKLNADTAACFHIDDATNTGVIVVCNNGEPQLFDSTSMQATSGAHPIDRVLELTGEILGVDAISFAWKSADWHVFEFR